MSRVVGDVPEAARGQGGGLRFAGYAAVFDAPDRGGDVIRPGAFGDVRRAPLLWQHRGAPVGSAEIREDARGLRVVGTVDCPRVGALVAGGALAGLSFGYRARDSRRGARGRELLAVDLIEVSLVAQPMQPLARVHFVES